MYGGKFGISIVASPVFLDCLHLVQEVELNLLSVMLILLGVNNMHRIFTFSFIFLFISISLFNPF